MCRIEGETTPRNFLAALGAVPELTFIETTECGEDTLSPGGSPSRRGLRHCLVLESIHTTETTDRLLVQLDSAPRIRAEFVTRLDFRQFVFKSFAGYFEPVAAHVPVPWSVAFHRYLM